MAPVVRGAPLALPVPFVLPGVAACSCVGGAGLLRGRVPGVCPSAGAAGDGRGSVGGAYGMELMEMMELCRMRS